MMTPDESALLQAVAASPADDTPRLVYADWLEDHGHAVRAEFIRLQCRIAQVEVLPRVLVNAHVGLWVRQQELLDNNLPELLGPLAGVETERPVVFRRGFVDEIELTDWDFVMAADTFAAVTPLPSTVRVTGVDGYPELSTRCPHLSVVTHIAAYCEPDPARPHILAAPPDWPGAARRLTRLVGMDLENSAMGSRFVFEAAHLDIPTLAELDLSHNQVSDVGVIFLLDSHFPRQLKRLVLGGNPLTDQAAFEIADRWPKDSPLENLNLRFTHIGTDGQRALLARFGGKVDLF